MQQLSGLDAVFLAAESGHQVVHVGQLVVFDKPDPDFAPYPAELVPDLPDLTDAVVAEYELLAERTSESSG